MNKIKRIQNKIKRKLNYVKYLKDLGMVIGDNVVISKDYSVIDRTEPKLVKIGDNCIITTGVTILTHDYSTFVICRKNGKLLGSGSPVNIGNNVFVGMNSTILKGTSVGDNVIIGAGSLVKGKLESNSVYAGVPARKVCSLEEYEHKMDTKQIDEALNILDFYYKENGDLPPENIFYKYNLAWLWTDISISDRYLNSRVVLNNPYFTKNMHEVKRPFKNYDDFLKFYLKKYNIKL